MGKFYILLCIVLLVEVVHMSESKNLTFEEWCEEHGFNPEEMKERKCVGCGYTARELWEEDPWYLLDSEWLYPDPYEGIGVYEEYVDEWLCAGCCGHERYDGVGVASVRDEVKVHLGKYTYTYNPDEAEDENLHRLVEELAEEIGKAIYWHPTDPWRGYWDLDRDMLEKWMVLYDDVILSGSRDAEELERFDRELTSLLDELGIRWARLTLHTSNVFSAGYTMLIRREDVRNPVTWVRLLVEINRLKLKYRDPVRFTITALTGKTDPSEFDEKDKLMYEAWERLNAGEDPDSVMKSILDKARGVA